MNRRVRALAALACGMCLLWAAPARGHQEQLDLRGVLDGLERGIVALEKLGRTEECNRLRHIADEVRGEMGSAQAPPKPQSEAQPRGGGQAIDVMRTALESLAAAGRSDAADLLERAIHARRMDLDGRDDDEAAQIRQQAPNVAQQVEILRLAARLLNQNGQPDRAEAVARMAERMWQRANAEDQPQPRGMGGPPRASSPGPPPPPPDLAPPPARDGERARLREDSMHRLDAIERQIEELRRALDQTRQQLRDRPPPGGAPRDMPPRPGVAPRRPAPPGSMPRGLPPRAPGAGPGDQPPGGR